MFRADTAWRIQKCETCGKKDDCRRGKCFVCCRPVSYRDLVRAGVPVGSAMALAGLLKRAKAQDKRAWEIEVLLAFAHPVLMENVKVDKARRLRLKVKNAHWVRSEGWSAGKR